MVVVALLGSGDSYDDDSDGSRVYGGCWDSSSELIVVRLQPY